MMDSNGVIRSVKCRKCYYTNTKILFFVVLLTLQLGVQSFTHQIDENADIDETPFDVDLGHDTKYGDVDNIEVHEVYIIDGVMHEGHPILMYKEDFVNEDFDPNSHKKLTKKKNIVRQSRHNTLEHYNALKPEKIYFDILPQRPILRSDDEDASDVKIVAELVPLVDKVKVTENDNLVSETGVQSNRINKFPRRRKRDIENENPFYRRSYYYTNNKAAYQYSTQASNAVFFGIHPQFHQNSKPNFVIIRHHVQGKPPIQPPKIGARGDFDDQKITTKPDTPGMTPPPSLWHDSNPENFDFSQYDNPNPNAVTDRPPSRQSSSRRQNEATGPFSAATPSSPATPRKVSNCVWAIVNCCTESDNKVRYYCFEEFSCHGAFWGLNPCADKVRDNAISYLDRAYA